MRKEYTNPATLLSLFFTFPAEWQLVVREPSLISFLLKKSKGKDFFPIIFISFKVIDFLKCFFRFPSLLLSICQSFQYWAGNSRQRCCPSSIGEILITCFQEINQVLKIFEPFALSLELHVPIFNELCKPYFSKLLRAMLREAHDMWR